MFKFGRKFNSFVQFICIERCFYATGAGLTGAACVRKEEREIFRGGCYEVAFVRGGRRLAAVD